ncbi:MAG: FKBP-type peptidyl-prolyl cis-trans isomerase [Candidatus Pacebacteria bacterium]|nr:FKBP-type peptidyl-prolyl cis-trans isomerase [Candidatus Paceibacterota bacterium]
MNMKTGIGAVVGIALIVLIVVLTNNGKKTDATNIEASNTETTGEVANTQADSSQETTMTNELQVTTTKEGTGTGAMPGDIVSVNYTGTLDNGVVFDSNVDPKFNHVMAFDFTLGKGQVIKGWDQGVLGMKKGEKRRLVIPASLGYGNMAVGNIPPNSTLTFDVEVLAINGK